MEVSLLEQWMLAAARELTLSKKKVRSDRKI
jgi:hypothetical protein